MQLPLLCLSNLLQHVAHWSSSLKGVANNLRDWTHHHEIDDEVKIREVFCFSVGHMRLRGWLVIVVGGWMDGWRSIQSHTGSKQQ